MDTEELARQHRAALRAELAYTSDSFFPIADWPRWAQQTFMKDHKNYQERFALFLFFYGNGLEGKKCIQWILYLGKYDVSAIRHLHNLLKDAENDKLDKNYMYWNMHLNRNIKWGQVNI